MEDNRDWVEAQIAECERQLSTMPETDWLGRVGFTHRLMRMKGIQECLIKRENEKQRPNGIEILRKEESRVNDIISDQK